MTSYKLEHSSDPNEIPISIKVRVISGCFHREHSPHAYTIIDKELERLAPALSNVSFEEHESGPEILTFVSAGLSLATSLISLVSVIISARSAGIKQGDHKHDPLEVVVRRVDDLDKLREERVAQIEFDEELPAQDLEQSLSLGLERLFDPREG